MESFEGFNYATRPNKNVERKMIFEGLAALSGVFPFSAYRYIGFGSMWFADFILAHRILGITRMTSIQELADFAKRARFNKPYACITVEEGDAATVLPKLPIEQGPTLLWLDYEESAARVLRELRELCARLASGSILLVTVNSSKEQVPPKNLEGANTAEKHAKEVELFRQTYGDLAPAEFPKDFFDKSRYPANIADTLIRHLTHATRVAGRDEHFEVLLNIAYKDGAPMITVGGMIANEVDRARLATARAGLPTPFAFMRSPGQIRIAVPPLTTREKLALDQLFPAEATPTEAAVAEIGFPLKQAQIDEYQRYYSRYPVYGELVP